MSTITIRLTSKEDKALNAYAKQNKVSKATAVKKVFFEHLAEEYDLKVAAEALLEAKKNNKTYTSEETDELLGIN